MPEKFEKLIKFFSKLPGIGPRQATRLVLAMLEWPDGEISRFAEILGAIKKGHLFCSQCFNFSETEKCRICSSTKRDQTRIAVVEKITDLQSMEKTGVFNGVYHVLGGAINPVEGYTPDKLRISELTARLKKLRALTSDIEIIIATNPNTIGETTALYLEQELAPLQVKITRLARGLASGSTVEYADEITLANAFKHRK